MTLGKICLLLFVICFWLGSGRADERIGSSGNAFLAKCSGIVEAADTVPGHNNISNDQWAQYMICLNWVEGFNDGINVYKEIESVITAAAGDPYCLPESASNYQAIAVIMKYMKDNPEKLTLPTNILAFAALRAAFPCSEAPAKTLGPPLKPNDN